MQTWYEQLHNPNTIDNISNYTGDLHEDKKDWFIAPVAVTRDSGIFDISNWESFLNSLRELNTEEDWYIKRTGHWGFGWFETILIKPDTPAHKLALETEEALSHYPLINESDYCERQWNYAQDLWGMMTIRERVELCQKHGHSIFSARNDSIPTEENCDIVYELENDH